MRRKIIYVAIFLMILQGGHTAKHHEHVHYEQPEWEVISEPLFPTSGSTCYEFCYYSP